MSKINILNKLFLDIMQNLLFFFILFTAILFIQLNHPLAMGLTLLIQTLFICLLTSLMNETYWFSYILFLVFMGGLLVLFIYVTSLASNETFSLSFNIIFAAMILFSISMLIMYFYDSMNTNNFFYSNNVLPENTINLIKLFNYPTNLITILLMNYLLITLIAVVKITNIFYGPLRHMYN
uniref:NADH-ubiquinone oxidoreductase chain 6 n=1 Tax=Megaselia scalaris TaxID=36166 RepID=W8EII5_MEGSC|nr:NADH dehydrogenase subunit 6 [Megaselia scalaris]AHJ91467.1 NADH dehydrogenase subunit 6 [Megaselia scalaris]